MERLRLWLREWLGIAGIERAAIHEYGVSAKDRQDISALIVEGNMAWKFQQEVNTELRAALAEANTEIDRLRMMITAEPAKKILKPRGWREAQELMQGTH